MKQLRALTLRTQYLLIVAFLAMFALGASLAHFQRSRAQADLAISLQRDIAVATKLPRLKNQLRRLDLSTAQYLETGDPMWLEQHESVLAELQRTQQDLFKLFPNRRERRILDQLDRQLADHFAREKGWIERKSAGRLSAAEAAKIMAARRSYEDILEVVLGMQEIELQGLPGRMEALENSARTASAVVLVLGLLASAAFVWALSRYIIRPISDLASYAAAWRPGEPWSCAAPAVSPEINGLFERVGSLAARVNEEYGKQRSMNQMKSQFVSLVSHELNNALSVIHAASSQLEETENDRGNLKRQRMYQMIHRQTRSLSTAIKNLLNAGRLETGRLALQKRRMEMADVLRSGLELMEALHQEKQLSVSLEIPQSPAPVFADPDALTLVVTNLLSNAIKYTPAGGSVTVGMVHERGEKGLVRVFFKDTGIGIQPEEREKIFSGFYRSQAGQRCGRGFGIGLSLAKAIIEAHGGKLEVESEPRKGSTFSFLLPLWIPDLKNNGAAEKKPDHSGALAA